MSAGEDRGSLASGRWLLAVAVALATFGFVRVRATVPGYVELHRLVAAAGLPDQLRNLDGSLLTILAAVLAARLAFGRGGVLRGLGLRASVVQGLVFGGVAGLPMVLQGLVATPGLRVDAGTLRGVLLAPFVEELFFRAVLVGITVRVGGRAFWPTAILAALVFASVHVPWDASFHLGHLGVIAATGAGGLWYAWILRTFQWNLWPTIVLHAVMNGAWTITGVADNAAGGLWPNVGRGLTIAVGSVLAIRHGRRSAAGAAPPPA